MFEDMSLKAVGLTIQLSHQHDMLACSNPVPLHDDFMVIHINSLHNVKVLLCGCNKASCTGDHIQQLLRTNLWPAMDAKPNTCFSFQMLENYHIMSLQGKVSMYDYYHVLEQMTNGTRTLKVQDQYCAFMCVIAQWCHLKLLKHASCGHHPVVLKVPSPESWPSIVQPVPAQVLTSCVTGIRSQRTCSKCFLTVFVAQPDLIVLGSCTPSQLLSMHASGLNAMTFQVRRRIQSWAVAGGILWRIQAIRRSSLNMVIRRMCIWSIVS